MEMERKSVEVNQAIFAWSFTLDGDGAEEDFLKRRQERRRRHAQACADIAISELSEF